jgi:hypothetical protein
VSRGLRDEAPYLADMVAQRRDRALFLLHPDRVSRWTHLLAGLGAARAALSAVRGHIAWVINTAVNEGLDAVVRASAPLRLWVSEADACVRCLAYTGRVRPSASRSRAACPGIPGSAVGARRRRAAEACALPLPHRALERSVDHRPAPVPARVAAGGAPVPRLRARPPLRVPAARLRAVRELLRTEPDLLPAVEARARTALRTGRFAGRIDPAPATGRRQPP